MAKVKPLAHKEIEDYKLQTSLVESNALKLEIKTDEDMAKASDYLSQVKRIKDSITARKEAIVRPMMDSLASTRDLFKPLETTYASAEKTIKSKMQEYVTQKEEEKKKIVEGVQSGEIKPEKAIAQIEKLSDKKSYSGSASKTSIRVITKLRIVDESQIPREFLVPNMAKITEAVIRNKQEVAGVETYTENQIASSSK
jgi:hypothetical protein